MEFKEATEKKKKSLRKFQKKSVVYFSFFVLFINPLPTRFLFLMILPLTLQNKLVTE